MKNGLFKILSAVAICVCAVAALTACDCKHESVRAAVENEAAATCSAEGSYDEVVYCTECDEELSRTTKRTDKTDHNYSGAACALCATAYPASEGLAFESNGDGTCSVIGIGDFDGSDLYIPLTSPLGDRVTKIANDAFAGCIGLVRVTIPNTVVTLGNSILNGTNVKSLVIPDSVTNVSAVAFSGVETLAELVNNSSLVIKVSAHFETHGGGSRLMRDGNFYFYPYSGANYLVGHEASEKVITLPQNYKNASYTIWNMAFQNRSDITGVIISDGITDIAASAFKGCKNIVSVTIGADVKNIGEAAFWNCRNLEKVIFNATSMNDLPPDNYTFHNAGKDIAGMNVTVGNNVTKIPSFLFEGCETLTSITMSDSITRIGDSAFEDCTNLSGISIPNAITSIGSCAFKNCTSIINITIPTNVTNIGSSAFEGCANIIETESSVHYVNTWAVDCDASATSASIKSGTLGIACGAFKNCDVLTSIVIPDTVTSIGASAFEGCLNLRMATIGSGVTSIGNSAFLTCHALTNVIFKNTSGWRCVPLSPEDGTKDISSEELAKESTAATYVKATYYNCNWKRS